MFSAHIHVIERKERNGKWKVKGLDYYETSAPENNAADFRTKPLIDGSGDTFDDACADAFQNFMRTPSCRPFVAYAIRFAGTHRKS